MSKVSIALAAKNVYSTTLLIGRADFYILNSDASG